MVEFIHSNIQIIREQLFDFLVSDVFHTHHKLAATHLTDNR